jgi:hypothetical protein
VPPANVSGGPGYAHAGFGNACSHYAQFCCVVSDGQAMSAEATMVLDATDLADTPLLSVCSSQGSEGNIAIQGLSAALADTDGSETVVLVITAMPNGTVLGDARAIARQLRRCTARRITQPAWRARAMLEQLVYGRRPWQASMAGVHGRRPWQASMAGVAISCHSC